MTAEEITWYNTQAIFLLSRFQCNKHQYVQDTFVTEGFLDM